MSSTHHITYINTYIFYLLQHEAHKLWIKCQSKDTKLLKSLGQVGNTKHHVSLMSHSSQLENTCILLLPFSFSNIQMKLTS